MRKFLAPLLLITLAGAAPSSPSRICEPDLIGPDDITFRVRHLVNPTGFGLYTTETQTVSCVKYQFLINCIVGHKVSLRNVDTDAFDDEPCSNHSIDCGKETTIVLSLDWGRLAPGSYEYLSYWQMGGCDPDGVVDSNSTVEIEVE